MYSAMTKCSKNSWILSAFLFIFCYPVSLSIVFYFIVYAIQVYSPPHSIPYNLQFMSCCLHMQLLRFNTNVVDYELKKGSITSLKCYKNTNYRETLSSIHTHTHTHTHTHKNTNYLNHNPNNCLHIIGSSSICVTVKQLIPVPNTWNR
jgi:hypothetical protein